MSMYKSEIVFDLIANMFGVERDREQLRAVLELYAFAYCDDLEESMGVPSVTAATLPVQEPALAAAEDSPEQEEPTEDGIAEAEQPMQTVASKAGGTNVGTQKAYSGFLSLRCAHCGDEATYCSRYPLTYHKCRACGEKTELQDMSLATASCECGASSRYMTNQSQWGFDIPCVICGSPVAVEHRSGEHVYSTVGKYVPKGKKKKGVVTSE